MLEENNGMKLKPDIWFKDLWIQGRGWEEESEAILFSGLLTAKMQEKCY